MSKKDGGGVIIITGSKDGGPVTSENLSCADLALIIAGIPNTITIGSGEAGCGLHAGAL